MDWRKIYMKKKSCEAELKDKILVLLGKPYASYVQPCKFIGASATLAFSAMHFFFIRNWSWFGLCSILKSYVIELFSKLHPHKEVKKEVLTRSLKQVFTVLSKWGYWQDSHINAETTIFCRMITTWKMSNIQKCMLSVILNYNYLHPI